MNGHLGDIVLLTNLYSESSTTDGLLCCLITCKVARQCVWGPREGGCGHPKKDLEATGLSLSFLVSTMRKSVGRDRKAISKKIALEVGGV